MSGLNLTLSEKAELCRKSHWLNCNLFSQQDDVLKAAAEALLSKIYQHSNPTRKHIAKHLPQLEILILNLLKAQKHRDFMTVSKAAGHYVFENGVSFRVLVAHHLHHLVAMGFLKEHKGYYGGIIGKRTRYELLSPAKEWLSKWPLDAKYFSSTADKEPIHLKDEDKKRIRIPDELIPETEQMAGNLQQLNQRLKYTFVDLFLTDYELQEMEEDLSSSKEDEEFKPASVNFERKFLHRVFNNSSLEQGGRFYGGWWQTIPKEKRLYLSIDNNFVEELDYSGMHVDLLYARHQSTCQLNDPYVFGFLTEEYRGQTKIIFNRLINSTKRSSFIQALEKDHDEEKVRLPKGLANFDEYVALIEETHHEIAGSFLTGASVSLQYMDSQIAERVMLRMLDEHSAVCLPVHDSFIVEIGEAEHLDAIMKETFFEFVGSEAQIKAVSRSLSDAQRQERVNLVEEIFEEGQGYNQRFMAFCRYYQPKHLIRGGDPFGDKPLTKLWSAASS